MGLKQRIAAFVARIQRFKVVRVLTRYGRDRGPILASGMAYQALFAVFAALWVAFSIAGLVVSGNTALQDAILAVLRDAVPGLIKDAAGDGAIDPRALTQGVAFSLSGVIALAGLLVTALGWLGAARDSIRTLFELPPARVNVVLQRLVDLGIGLAFAVLLLLAAALSFAGGAATETVFAWLSIDADSVAGLVLSRVVTLAVAVVVYAVAMGLVYRVLAGVKVPWRILRGGVLIAAIGLAGLTVAGGLLLGGATSNPLIASFAVVAGLLIYYNFVSQVILLAASWMAVGVDDAGLVLDQQVFDERLEAARALVAEHAPAEEPRRSFRDRLLRRKPRVTSDG